MEAEEPNLDVTTKARGNFFWASASQPRAEAVSPLAGGYRIELPSRKEGTGKWYCEEQRSFCRRCASLAVDTLAERHVRRLESRNVDAALPCLYP